MSYILEALRRAETEREGRRRVPGLHAQPVLPGEEPPAPRSKAWLWVVLGLAAGLLLALLWRGSERDAADEEALAARASAAGSVTSHAPADEPALPASAVAEAAPPAPAAADAPPPAVAHEQPPAHRKPGATAKAAPKPRAKAPEKTTEPAAATAAKAVAAPRQTAQTPAVATASASAPEPPLRTLADLPADVRSRVPPLSFGGSVYSDVSAQRLVILNGQVLREGDAIADGVWLAQIRPHSAVIRVGEQRFEYPF